MKFEALYPWKTHYNMKKPWTPEAILAINLKWMHEIQNHTCGLRICSMTFPFETSLLFCLLFITTSITRMIMITAAMQITIIRTVLQLESAKQSSKHYCLQFQNFCKSLLDTPLSGSKTKSDISLKIRTLENIVILN